MGWTNAALQSVITQYGERINSLSLNNGKYLFIGYDGSPKLSDLTLKTVSGVDVIVVKHTQKQGGRILTWESLITTEFIEAVDILSEEDIDYRLDPLTLK